MKQQKTKASLQAELDNAQLRIEELERALHAMDPKRAASSPAATTAEPDLLSLFNLLPVGVSVLDHNQQVVFQNAALSNILGLTEEELQEGEYRQRTYLQSDGTRMPADGFASVRARQSGKAVYNVETGIVNENGETIWTSVSAVPLLSNHWKMAIFTLDITERKQAESQREAALSKVRESEERYNLLFEKSTIPAVLLKLPEVVIVDANEAAEKLTGYLRPEMRGRTAAELGLITHKQRAQAISQFEKRGELAENERQVFTKSGEERIVVSRTNRLEIGGLPHAITTLEDVTERKQADAKRDRIAERLNLATQSARMGIWDWDIVKNEIVWDDQMYALYGLKPGEFGGAYEAWQRGVHPDDRDAGNEVSAAAVRGEREYDTEFRVLWPDGSVHWLKANGQVFRDEQGTPLRMVGVNYDITERKQIEEALERTRNVLAEAQKVAHLGSFEYVAATQTTVWSEEEYRIYGLDPDGPSPAYDVMLQKCIHPDDAALLHETFTKAMQSNAVYELEHRIVRPDGSVRWVYDRALPYLNERGELIRYVGATLDITERKQAEDQLRESEERLALVMEGSQLGYWDWNIETGTVHRNTRWAEMLGYTLEEIELNVRQWTDLHHPDDREAAWKSIQDHLDGKTPAHRIEYRMLANDGQYKWILDQARVVKRASDGKPLRMSGTHTDITERKQAEEKLRESEELLRLAYDATELGIWKNDLQTGSVEFDERARIHYGFDTLHTTLAEVTSRLHPEDLARVGAEIAAATGPTGNGKFATEYRVTHPDGSVHWLAIGVRVTFEGEGEQRHSVIGYGTTLDITERKQAEEALRRRTEELEQLLDMLPEAIWIAEDPECKVIRGNRFANQLLGISEKGNISQSADAPAIRLRQFSQDRELDPDELPMQMAARTGMPQIDFELRIERPDAVTRILLGGAIPLFDKSGGTRGAVAAFHDITERKFVEVELRRSNAELEQFAYVASHDLQEPLRAMTGMVQLLGNKYKGQLDERADEYIGHAVEAASRMQALINDLLAYSRVGSRGKPLEPVPASDCLQTALRNLLVSIRESGAIITCDDLPTVHADSVQLIQLFQNLVGNGIKFRGAREPRIHVSATQLKDSWRFSVRDNGIGIEPQYFERIFLVFQRLHTRREYAGTGIGLALCKKIVERHGGAIWVESQPGEGSTFYFTFPIRS